MASAPVFADMVSKAKKERLLGAPPVIGKSGLTCMPDLLLSLI